MIQFTRVGFVRKCIMQSSVYVGIALTITLYRYINLDYLGS